MCYYIYETNGMKLLQERVVVSENFSPELIDLSAVFRNMV